MHAAKTHLSSLLDRVAGGPVDLLVNDRLVARGEVVAIEENFGVRITELIEKPPQPGR